MKCTETGQNCTTVPCASCPRKPADSTTAPLSSSRSDAGRRDGLLILVRNMREQIKRSPGMSHHPFSDEGWAYLETILSERGTLDAAEVIELCIRYAAPRDLVAVLRSMSATSSERKETSR